MRPPSNRFVYARCAVVLAACVLSAQSKPPASSAAPPDDDVTFKSYTRLVVLHASVADKSGKLVTNLSKEAFKVFENGHEQVIKAFHREDVPISLGIVIDNSGSMVTRRHKVEVASLELVKASNPQDEVFVVNFNDEAFLDVPFTNDIKKLEEGVARIDSRGGTALRDAISTSIDYVKGKGKKDKKVLLVVTDGYDTNSSDRDTLEKLTEKARRSEVLIYAIGLLSDDEPHEAKLAKRVLNTLTVASGGLAHYPKDLAEVEKIALQVAQEIRNQYIITYSPGIQELDGSFRQIKVTVNGPGHPTVRTRTGYYATPDTKTAGVFRSN